ncbi:family 43 glycosylhydrolase [Microbacterium sp. X-17]|uniref:family 43 glycosylhydrolase n=1 Tax=Microbacterium sp. X-17 TaxID=3144404 RepID=UPI0031F5572A
MQMTMMFGRARGARLLLVGALMLLLTLVLSGVGVALTAAPAQALTGGDRIHDPSVIKVGSCYYAFSTGFENDPNDPSGAPTTHQSCGSANGPWTKINNVWDTNPSWIDTALPNRYRNIWGPDINYINGTYYLYYSAATFNPTPKAAVGLATASSITGPWTDQGEITDVNFPIDPDVIQAQDGNYYLSTGSFGGVYMHMLDPVTGKLSTTNTTMWYLTKNTEGTTITYHDGYYYLLGSRGQCCRGVNSTYWTVAARSTSVTGPYVDANGTAMTDSSGNAGLTVLTGPSPKVGAGGGDVYTDGSSTYLAYHYYDANNNGLESLDIRKVNWASSGWPQFDPPLGVTSGYKLQNGNSNMCADLWGLSTAQDAPIDQGVCNTGANQAWNFTAVGSNYEIVSAYSGLCLEMYGFSTANGTAATQHMCNAGTNQLWTKTATVGGYVTLVNVNSGKCLEVYGNSTANGAGMNQWTCNGGRNQQWLMG